MKNLLKEVKGPREGPRFSLAEILNDVTKRSAVAGARSVRIKILRG